MNQEYVDVYHRNLDLPYRDNHGLETRAILSLGFSVGRGNFESPKVYDLSTKKMNFFPYIYSLCFLLGHEPHELHDIRLDYSIPYYWSSPSSSTIVLYENILWSRDPYHCGHANLWVLPIVIPRFVCYNNRFSPMSLGALTNPPP